MLNNYNRTSTSTIENQTNKNRRIGKLLLLAPLFIVLTVGLAVLTVPVVPARADVTIVDCPDAANGGFNFAVQSSDYVVPTQALATIMNWSLTTPNKSPTNGVPGVIEFCVYPNAVVGSANGDTSTVTGESTSAVGANGSGWSAGLDCGQKGKICVKSERPDGNPANIPDDGTTTSNVLGISFSSQPTSYVVVLHINDSAECTALFAPDVGQALGTCFVFPSTEVIHPPSITKDAAASYKTTYHWTITKDVDSKKVFTAGGSPATFTYTVTVTHDAGTNSGFSVSGTITVMNPNSAPITGAAISDTLDDSTVCTVSGFSGILSPGSNAYSYTCSPANASATMNNATITWPTQSLSSGSLPGGSATFIASFSWSVTLVDTCVTVTDTQGGTLGTVCVGGANPKSFTYSKTFNDPAGTCTSHDNTATFVTNDTGATGSASQTVTDCQGADLTVSKDATPSFTRTFTWGISKTVDNNKILTAGGGPGTATYTVSVTHDSGTDSAWAISGTITVSNPNDWEAIAATVTDAVPGGTCTVNGGANVVSVPISSSVSLPYTCTFLSNPGSGTNTATATWDNIAASTLGNSASGSAMFAFGAPTNIVDGSVSVTDTQGGFLGTVSYSDPSPTTFSYSATFNDPAGTCTPHDNTATFTTNTSGTTGSASQTVKDCQGANLTVNKTASLSFKRAFGWTIQKSVDQTSVTTTAGSPATFNYVVTVTGTSTDSNFQVTGTIHIVNPNDWESITASVADAVDNGGTCTVASSTVTVPSSGSVDVTYTCTYSSAPSAGTNTATVTWDATAASTPSGSASGSAGIDFSTVIPSTTGPATVSVTDTLGGPLGTCSTPNPVGPLSTNPSSNTCTFPYSKTFTDPIGVCTSHTNISKIVETGQTASQTVTDCQTGGFVSDTGFCNVPLTSTRIILTQDTTGHFGLTATNPGQYYYNFFLVGSASAGNTFTATIPFPFISQGANPFQVFDSTLFPSCGGTVPTTNFNSLFSISPTSIAIGNYSPQDFTASITVTFTVGSGGLPSGNYWFALHLNYGLKGFEYDKGTGTCMPALAATGPSVTIGCPQSYTFSNSLSASSSTITSVNAFYKDPGFLGTITSGVGTPIMNVQVRIMVGGKPLVTVYTNQDGVYSYQYVYTGAKTTYSITASCMGASQTVSGTLTSKQLIVKNFTFN